MATALLSLEGVLKTEGGDPIQEGIKLYRILAEHYRVVICSDLSTDLSEHWLRNNLIIGYADLYDDKDFFEGQDLRARHLDMALARGKVSLFVDPDADRCAYALSKNVTTMLFAEPKFIRTSRMVKPWEDLKSEIERQRDALLEAHLGSQIKRYE
jgi:hypothetical protein